MQDFSQHLPTSGSRQELTRSNNFSLMPYEQDNLFKSMNGVYRLSQFAGAAPIKRMPLPSDVRGLPTVEFSITFMGCDYEFLKSPFRSLCFVYASNALW